jgi:mutator family transposase
MSTGSRNGWSRSAHKNCFATWPSNRPPLGPAWTSATPRRKSNRLTIELAIPKLRQGSYYPEWLLERRRRAERALATVVATSYLLGCRPGGWRSWLSRSG